MAQRIVACLLDADHVGDQRVFLTGGDTGKLARIPFYS